MIMAPISGIPLNRVGPKLMASAGAVSVSAAVFLMSRWTLDAGPGQILSSLMLNGFGLSPLFILLFTSGVGAVPPRKTTGAVGLLALHLHLDAAFGSAIPATMVERGVTRYHAILVAHATATSTALASELGRLPALASAGGAGPVAAKTRALAILDGMLTPQSSVLALEHAFEIVAPIVLLVLPGAPFLRKPAAPAAH